VLELEAAEAGGKPFAVYRKALDEGSDRKWVGLRTVVPQPLGHPAHVEFYPSPVIGVRVLRLH